MTVTPCPYGCGGFFVANETQYCPSCRRDRFATEMELKPVDACWQWWGPPEHRMRCRKPLGHTGEHDTIPNRTGPAALISTSGQLAAAVGEEHQ